MLAPSARTDPRLSRLHYGGMLSDKVDGIVKKVGWIYGLSETDFSNGREYDAAGYEKLVAAGIVEALKACDSYRIKSKQVNLAETEMVLSILETEEPNVKFNLWCAGYVCAASIAAALWGFIGAAIGTITAIYLISGNIRTQRLNALANRKFWKDKLDQDRQSLA